MSAGRVRSEAIRYVERELSCAPSMVPAPAGLHARVMNGLAHAPGSARRGLGRALYLGLASAAAACLGVASVAIWASGAPAPAPVQGLAAGPAPLNAFAPGIDPVPVVLPAASFIAASLERPLMVEAQSMLEDTRRAADFVVSCLPFTSR